MTPSVRDVNQPRRHATAELSSFDSALYRLNASERPPTTRSPIPAPCLAVSAFVALPERVAIVDLIAVARAVLALVSAVPFPVPLVPFNLELPTVAPVVAPFVEAFREAAVVRGRVV